MKEHQNPDLEVEIRRIKDIMMIEKKTETIVENKGRIKKIRSKEDREKID